MSKTVSMPRGSVEYIYADIRTDRVLSTQPVMMSVSTAQSPGAWVPAEWVGPPGKFRSARILLDGTLERGTYTVLARISDTPESPIVNVGMLKIT